MLTVEAHGVELIKTRPDHARKPYYSEPLCSYVHGKFCAKLPSQIFAAITYTCVKVNRGKCKSFIAAEMKCISKKFCRIGGSSYETKSSSEFDRNAKNHFPFMYV